MSSRVALRAEARARREEAEGEALAAAQRRRSVTLLLGACGVAVAVVAIAVAISSNGSSDEHLIAGERPLQSARVAAMFGGIPEHGEALGRSGAPLTLVEFADLKCPICRQFAVNVLPGLVSRYVRDGRLRIVFEPQTFVGSPPGDSERAARFALAAGAQNRLWPFTELWYDNQQDENHAYATDDFIRTIASGVRGLGSDRALSQRYSPQVTEALTASETAFERDGFAGTPSFLLGRTGAALRALDATTQAARFTGAIDRLLRG